MNFNLNRQRSFHVQMSVSNDVSSGAFTVLVNKHFSHLISCALFSRNYYALLLICGQAERTSKKNAFFTSDICISFASFSI